MTWPGKPPLTAGQSRARKYAIASFILGVLSVTLFFLTQTPTPTGWGPALLLVILPIVFGAIGIICAAISRRYVWVVLNSLLLAAFPLLMVFGSLWEFIAQSF